MADVKSVSSILKSPLWTALRDMKGELHVVGSTCRTFANRIAQINEYHDRENRARALDATWLIQWKLSSWNRVDKFTLKFYDPDTNWKVSEQFISLANAPYLTPILHHRGTSTTHHNAAMILAKYAFNQSSVVFDFIEANPVTAGADEWLSESAFLEWQRHCRVLALSLLPFARDGWPAIRGGMEVEFWRTANYLMANPSLLEKPPARKVSVRQKDPEIEKRDKKVFGLWIKSNRSPKTAATDYNKTLKNVDDPRLSANNVSTIVRRYLKDHPELEEEIL